MTDTIEQITEKKRNPIRDMYEKMYRQSTGTVPTENLITLMADET